MNKFPFALPEKESKKIIFRNTFIREKKSKSQFQGSYKFQNIERNDKINDHGKEKFLEKNKSTFK